MSRRGQTPRTSVLVYQHVPSGSHLLLASAAPEDAVERLRRLDGLWAAWWGKMRQEARLDGLGRSQALSVAGWLRRSLDRVVWPGLGWGLRLVGPDGVELSRHDGWASAARAVGLDRRRPWASMVRGLPIVPGVWVVSGYDGSDYAACDAVASEPQL
ncbi:MAG: hypothetical protein R3E01_19770 [Pirellulaceae bacterium]